MMPEFEVSKMWKWASGQAPDGHLPEYLGSFGLGPLDIPGGRTMGDTTTIWIIETLELYLHTGDISLVTQWYPVAVKALDWLIAASQQLGLPYELVCTYDILDLQQYPTTTFNSFLHLAAVKAMMELATIMGDNSTYQTANAAFLRGQSAMESQLWNSTYNYFRAYTTGNAIMSDCMYGQMLALEHGLGFLVNTTMISQHLAAELKYNLNDYGFTVLTGRSSPPPTLERVVEISPKLGRLAASWEASGSDSKLTIDTTDDVNWMGGGPTWSYMALSVGGFNVTAALEPTRLTVDNFRTRLADWWNVVGITSSGDWGSEDVNGMPYVTSHYGFLLPDYHLIYALSGQMTNIPGGSLTFAPLYDCPFNLPLLLAGTTGTIACNAAGAYTVSIMFGSLTLPAGGLSIAGSAYPTPVDLAAGDSISW